MARTIHQRMHHLSTKQKSHTLTLNSALQNPSSRRCTTLYPDRNGSYHGITKEQIDDVLSEVVPLLIRGKELNGMMVEVSGPLHSLTVYEHVTISELLIAGVGQGITVTFNEFACAKQTEP